MYEGKYLRVKTFAAFFLIFLLSFSNTVRSSSSSCPVAFRIDDVQDFFLRDIQLTILSYFMSKGIPVTLGLISGYIGRDVELIETLRQGYQASLFEIAYHGFANENLTKLSYEEQKGLVKNGTDNLRKVFGEIELLTFIPPMFEFDQNTSKICVDFGFKIISSSINPIARADSPSFDPPIIHLPETVDSANYSKGVFHEVPVDTTFRLIQESVAQYGYAIVTLHPQQFSIFDDQFNYVGINQTRIAQFDCIVDRVRENYHLTTISNIKDLIYRTESLNTPMFLGGALAIGLSLVIVITILAKYHNKLHLF